MAATGDSLAEIGDDALCPSVVGRGNRQYCIGDDGYLQASLAKADIRSCELASSPVMRFTG